MMLARHLVSMVALVGVSVAWAASVEIHPAGLTVPENLLRIELRFEQPQCLPFDIARLKLLDANGLEVQHALLDLTLPSADGRRITVLMDPGRVKSGVGPNLDAGRALQEGSTVSLRLVGTDAAQPLVVKTWQVTAAASRPLRPEAWKLALPRRSSRDTLVVDMQMPISSVGEALIAVLDGHGRRVDGTTSLAEGDAAWRFTPSRPWAAGTHRLVTHPDLEDPAGNRRCAAFETSIRLTSPCEGTSLAFTPTSAS
jgi:hypothetical protein